MLLSDLAIYEWYIYRRIYILPNFPQVFLVKSTQFAASTIWYAYINIKQNFYYILCMTSHIIILVCYSDHDEYDDDDDDITIDLTAQSPNNSFG